MSQTLEDRIKDPGSAITHFIGMLMAIFAAVPLLIKAAHEPGRIYVISIAVYAASLILLYAASTTYHTFNRSEQINTILKKIDHMMISVLSPEATLPSVCWYSAAEPGLFFLASYGESPLSESLSRLSGYTALSGYLPYYISEWAGPACLHLPRY